MSLDTEAGRDAKENGAMVVGSQCAEVYTSVWRHRDKHRNAGNAKRDIDE